MHLPGSGRILFYLFLTLGAVHSRVYPVPGVKGPQASSAGVGAPSRDYNCHSS